MIMSCNGCRVLRKGCSEACVLRPSIEWIDSPEAQAHATVFVAKFFGRAGLVASLSAVPLHHRPGLFRSLLYEACGRTINPVSGAIGVMWTGNWDVCQAAAEAVLRGETLQPAQHIADSVTSNDMGDLYGDVIGMGSSTRESSSPESSTGQLLAKCSMKGMSLPVGQCGLDLPLMPISSSPEDSVGKTKRGGERLDVEEQEPMLLNLFR